RTPQAKPAMHPAHPTHEGEAPVDPRAKGAGGRVGHLGLAPLANEIVIAADQRSARRLVRIGLIEALDSAVHFIEQGALLVVADQALRPEEARGSHTAC